MAQLDGTKGTDLRAEPVALRSDIRPPAQNCAWLGSEEDAQKALDRALSLDIQLVASPKLAMVVFAFASQFRRLAAYDMFYLALAKKVGEFWTADKHLYNACVQQGWAIVRWLGNIDVA